MEDLARFEELEQAYNAALDQEKNGKTDAAVSLYQKVLELDPADHAGASVRLASLGAIGAPAKAPDAYVKTLFNQHAEVFDLVLVEQLGYAVPLMLRDAINKLGLSTFSRMLDLGCGTGLTAEAFEDATEFRCGVDLSDTMIEVCDDKELFDELYVSEVVNFLKHKKAEGWDLITATDVLPYMGELEEFFSLAETSLKPGGHFCFSSETLFDVHHQSPDYSVGQYHRFAHSTPYITSLLSKLRLETLYCEPITVRYEQGQPVPGHMFIYQKKP
ncbi:methyltransferase [Polycladidibacter hongkongensis]|uniref:methyltransferase n=1 Tax=Polycladidibacter hongkongensis TaxID=1647556 RepID=UPI00082F0AB2|nr:methyltransferase [Pseudovibrio hongkongensis]